MPEIKQTRQTRSVGYIDPESDWELRRLAKMWGISIAQARQRCYHYMGAICRKSHDRALLTQPASGKLKKG
jgi:hypothetical protein